MSHQLGAHGAASFADTSAPQLKCYAKSSLQPMTELVAAHFVCGNARAPLRGSPAWIRARAARDCARPRNSWLPARHAPSDIEARRSVALALAARAVYSRACFSPEIFATVFGVIFIAELPDKTAVAALVLATRHRALPVFAGTALALVVQSLIAVAAGGVLGLAPATPGAHRGGPVISGLRRIDVAKQG